MLFKVQTKYILSNVFQVADITMPNCNQPLTLTEICMRREREILNNVLAYWIRILRRAGDDGIWSYYRQVKNVLNKCKTLNEFLASLPTPILYDLIPPLKTDFEKKISSYHKNILGIKRFYKNVKEIHEDVCTKMLQSVLVPSTTRYNMGLIFSSYEQPLIIHIFPSTPNLTNLEFGTEQEIDNSAPLANNNNNQTNTLLVNVRKLK
jgi:hypothetical protein